MKKQLVVNIFILNARFTFFKDILEIEEVIKGINNWKNGIIRNYFKRIQTIF